MIPELHQPILGTPPPPSLRLNEIGSEVEYRGYRVRMVKVLSSMRARFDGQWLSTRARGREYKTGNK